MYRLRYFYLLELCLLLSGHEDRLAPRPLLPPGHERCSGGVRVQDLCLQPSSLWRIQGQEERRHANSGQSNNVHSLRFLLGEAECDRQLAQKRNVLK